MTQLNNSKIGLIYGTDTGNTEEVGERICEALSGLGHTVDMINVLEASADLIESFDLIIMGIPTWEFGGIQADWEDFEEEILNTQLMGKTVALYGLGDQFGYGDYFLDAMGWLNERVLKAGAKVVGHWSTAGYDFEESRAVNEDKTLFCGLAIDEDQQDELTDKRISTWVDQLSKELT